MYTGGSWYGNEIFVEVQTEFQRKTPWFPLNQNVIAKNYKTTVFMHNVSGDITTHPIARFPGWVLNGSLFIAGDRIWLIRGTSDALGDWSRELLSIPFARADVAAGKTAEATTAFKPDRNLLAAVPSPSGAYIALLLTDATLEKPTENLRVAVADAKSMSFLTTLDISWKGVPGVPEISWSKKSDKLYLRLDQSVFETQPEGGRLVKSALFPRCFMPTSSGRMVSDRGVFFTRTQDNRIELTKTADFMAFDAVPMTANPAEIGSGCP
ncbi:MAG: hypothetical protein HY042_10865 [Spirochaetia bacterium]|nr:hypothetical protein [Spirochaetia bacterium]